MTGLLLMLQRQNLITDSVCMCARVCVCAIAENCEFKSFVLSFWDFQPHRRVTAVVTEPYVCA